MYPSPDSKQELLASTPTPRMSMTHSQAGGHHSGRLSSARRESPRVDTPLAWIRTEGNHREGMRLPPARARTRFAENRPHEASRLPRDGPPPVRAAQD